MQPKLSREDKKVTNLISFKNIYYFCMCLLSCVYDVCMRGDMHVEVRGHLPYLTNIPPVYTSGPAIEGLGLQTCTTSLASDVHSRAGTQVIRVIGQACAFVHRVISPGHV